MPIINNRQAIYVSLQAKIRLAAVLTAKENKMKNKKFGLKAVFFLIACIFAGGEEDSSADEAVLYSAGSYNGNPCYWQNSARRNLSMPSGARGGTAVAITVGTDGTVYILGNYRDRNDNLNSCYWQNGTRKDLPIPSGAEDCLAVDITVGADKTVYILGNYRDRNYNNSFLYWQDAGGRINVNVTLPYGAYTEGSAIAVGADGLVYISGSYGNDPNYPPRFPYFFINVDRARINLPVPARNDLSSANAIAVGADGTIYTSGTTGWISGDAGGVTPCYWQNDVRRELPLPANASSSTSKFPIVLRANGTVYIAGSYTEWQNNNDIHLICYWQNGVRRDILLPAGIRGDVNAIAVGTDGTVYISGYYVDNSRHIVCYWQGNSRYDIGVLSNGENITSQFIFIR